MNAILQLCMISLLKTYQALNAYSVSLILCFIDFGLSVIRLGIDEVEVVHTIKALLVHFWLNSENGMYRITLFVVGHVPFGFV